MLKIENLKKTYTTYLSKMKVEALKDISFEIKEGEFVSIMGESGSGKTTLLNIISTIDTPTLGKIFLDGEDLSNLKDSERAIFRREKIGFVFQEFNLLDTMTVFENIAMPLILLGRSKDEITGKVAMVLSQTGIQDIKDKYPYEISGGQKQRTACARALIVDPKIILADEPTGALDSGTSNEILSLFEKINDEGATVLMVTHSAMAASRSKRVLFIKDGKIFHDMYRGDASREEFYKKILDAQVVLQRERGI